MGRGGNAFSEGVRGVKVGGTESPCGGFAEWIHIAGDDGGGSLFAGHGAGRQAEHPAAQDRNDLAFQVAADSSGGGHGGDGAVGGCGEGVAQFGAQLDDAGAGCQKAVFGESAAEFTPGGDGGVAVFEEVFAFLWQAAFAKEALAA